MAPKSRTALTYADLREMPDDGRRYELIEGGLVVSPAPGWTHQRVVDRMYRLLMRAEDAGHGVAVAAPTDVVLDPDQSAVEPDLLFIAGDHRQIVHDEAVFGAPDLVIEVLSESTRRRDLGAKLRLYAHHGVGLYWVADPAEQVVRVYELRDGGYADPTFLRAGDILACPLLPAVATPVDTVFAG